MVYGTTIHNLLCRCLCNLSSRQNNCTVVSALGKGYQETHKSWRGLKAMNIHLLNPVMQYGEAKYHNTQSSTLCAGREGVRVVMTPLN